MLCNICHHGMQQVDIVNSGNSKFITYQCTRCMNRIVRCEGLSFMSNI